jgi:hypothetical protein
MARRDRRRIETSTAGARAAVGRMHEPNPAQPHATLRPRGRRAINLKMIDWAEASIGEASTQTGPSPRPRASNRRAM